MTAVLSTASVSMNSRQCAVPKPSRTRAVSAQQVRAYASKAAEFAEAAASDLEAGRNIASSIATKAVERAQRCAAVARRAASTIR